MEIALRRLMEMAVHVKLASEAVLAVAHHLATVRPDEGTSDGAAWCHTMDQLVTLNVQLGFMERILRNATDTDVAPPRPGRNGRVVSA